MKDLISCKGMLGSFKGVTRLLKALERAPCKAISGSSGAHIGLFKTLYKAISGPLKGYVRLFRALYKVI